MAAQDRDAPHPLLLWRASWAGWFRPVLCSGLLGRLPLQIGDLIGSAAGKRDHMILHIAWTRAACFAGGGARVLLLELPRHLRRSIRPCRSGGWQAGEKAQGKKNERESAIHGTDRRRTSGR